MNKTKIEWCDSTWNPVTGCLHGCEYCYAERIAERFSGNITATETVKRITINDGRVIWDLPSPIHKIDGKVSPYPCGFVPTFHRYKLDDPQKWKKPRTIFVCSMADMFGDWVPDEWIEDVFKACEKASQHKYLFLTKNPNRYIELDLNGKLLHGKNVWYGMTVADKKQASAVNTVIEDMTDMAGAFLSIEPILEDVAEELKDAIANFVDWIIIGAETGNRKNKVVPKKKWIDNICKVADESNIPVFMKDSLIPIVGEENMRREFPWITN